MSESTEHTPSGPCERLLDFVYDELSESDAAAFREHLESCARCAAEVAAMKRVRGAVKLALPMVEPAAHLGSTSGSALHAQLMHAAAQRARTVAQPRGKLLQFARKLTTHPGYAAAAAALVVAGTLTYNWQRGYVMPEPEVAAPAPAPTEAAPAAAPAAPPPPLAEAREAAKEAEALAKAEAQSKLAVAKQSDGEGQGLDFRASRRGDANLKVEPEPGYGYAGSRATDAKAQAPLAKKMAKRDAENADTLGGLAGLGATGRGGGGLGATVGGGGSGAGSGSGRSEDLLANAPSARTRGGQQLWNAQSGPQQLQPPKDGDRKSVGRLAEQKSSAPAAAVAADDEKPSPADKPQLEESRRERALSATVGSAPAAAPAAAAPPVQSAQPPVQSAQPPAQGELTRSAETLRKKAEELAQSGRCDEASKLYDELEKGYPGYRVSPKDRLALVRCITQHERTQRTEQDLDTLKSREKTPRLPQAEAPKAAKPAEPAPTPTSNARATKKAKKADSVETQQTK